MHSSIDGFYAAYLTGSGSQGLAMLVFRNGIIAGVDVGGVEYDGTYRDTEGGFALTLTFSIPPNTLLVQGVTSGPKREDSKLEFKLPMDFLSQPFIRVNARHGPVNVKFSKLRGLDV